RKPAGMLLRPCDMLFVKREPLVALAIVKAQQEVAMRPDKPRLFLDDAAKTGFRLVHGSREHERVAQAEARTRISRVRLEHRAKIGYRCVKLPLHDADFAQ